MNFKELFEQLAKTLSNFSKKQKIVLATSIIVIISFLLFTIFYKPSSSLGGDYVPLFEKVSASDSALIMQELDKDNIDYKVVDDGVIVVPSDVVYETRIKVAAQGIPKNNTAGFELFDKSDFGATDFEQKIKYLRAIEGELVRSIESLSPIKTASVHIALPKESLFVEKQIPASAAVVLNIKPFYKITKKQILGIKNLVASAITNLSSSDVKVVDQKGEPLGDEDVDFESDTIKAQITYRKNYEKNYEEKIVNVLAPIVGGVDKVVAKVNIEFDFAKQETVSEVYDPNSVARSEQTLEEKKEGIKGQEVGGVPGAVSNIGPVQGLENNTNKENYEKSQTTTNYEISKKVTNTKGAFANIKRVTVATVIDGKYTQETSEDGEPTLKYNPLSAQEIEQISKIVKQTVGFDEKRGDEVTVTNFQFKAIDEQVSPTQEFKDMVLNYLSPIVPIIKYIIAFVILFVLYKKIIVPFSQKMLEELKDDEVDQEIVKLEEELGADDTLEEYKKKKQEIEKQLGLSTAKGEGDLKYDIVIQKIVTYCEQHPDEMAKLIENMIERNLTGMDGQ